VAIAGLAKFVNLSHYCKFLCSCCESLWIWLMLSCYHKKCSCYWWNKT